MTAPVPPVVNAADQRFAAVAMLDQQLVAQAKAEWYRMQLTDLQGSFVNQFFPAVQPGLVQAQATAARFGAAAVAERTGQPVSVDPAAFAGAASDGGPLPHLLAQPLVGLYVDLENGVPPELALGRRMDSMDQLLVTQVQDAARAAEQVQMTAARGVHFWVRVVEPGACSRCLILAGKRYRWDADFLRHPRCRCHAEPETETTAPIGSPQAVFDSMSPEEQDAAFGVANAQAIRDGADIYRVVNATGSTSGMTSVLRNADGSQVSTTDPYGSSVPGTRLNAGAGFRPVPQGIYQLAGGDRDEAIRLLGVHGYLR